MLRPCTIVLVSFLRYALISSNTLNNQTYEYLKTCVKTNTLILRSKNHIHSPITWYFPEDAEEHYSFILRETSKYRNVTAHPAAGYTGPWIENYFIRHFVDKPLSFFGGFIPLFIQWVDIKVHEDLSKRPSLRMKNVFRTLNSLLRPNILYITVSQDDEGLSQFQQRNPNVITFSAGGFGHIPIPLIKGEMAYVNPPSPIGSPSITSSQSNPKLQFMFDFSFVGNRATHTMRSEMIGELNCLLKRYRHHNLTYTLQPSSTWKSDIINSKFNLAPRGFGRTSYRISEIIQLGRIPIYIYDDVPWVPYEGTLADYHSVGFVAQIGNLEEVIQKAIGVTDSQLQILFSRIKAAREWYTYEGVVRQMELFFQNPAAELSLLKCRSLPATPA